MEDIGDVHCMPDMNVSEVIHLLEFEQIRTKKLSSTVLACTHFFKWKLTSLTNIHAHFFQ